MEAQKQDAGLSREQFESLFETDRKTVVRRLATKIADSKDLKQIWVDSQVDGLDPLIEWERDKLEALARDYFEWDR